MFVLSSLREGMPYALLEAMAMALPVIVSDAPANIEAVGDAGVVVGRANIGSLVAAMGELAQSEARRTELGIQARRRVAKHFGVSEMVMRTRQAYEAAISEAR